MKLQNISKVYEGKEYKVEALQDITLSVQYGEMLAIMGTSGSGKSTLLNILGCIDRASSGQYYLDGKEITTFSNKEMARLRTYTFGFVLQEFALLERYTVAENLKIPMEYSKILKKRQERLIDELLLTLGISKKKNSYLSMLSGGQRQRVAIARALINDPDIILCDEPTGALDSRTSEDIMELFMKINDIGKTLIIVTHDSKIAEYCHRCIYIEDGIIV